MPLPVFCLALMAAASADPQFVDQVSDVEAGRRFDGPGQDGAARGQPDVTALPIQGEDRCDAAQPDARDAACATVLETRSAELAPERAQPDWPEGALLEGYARPAPSGPQNAAQRLAANASDPDSIDDQSIAAIVLEPAPVPDAPPPDAPPRS